MPKLNLNYNKGETVNSSLLNTRIPIVRVTAAADKSGAANVVENVIGGFQDTVAELVNTAVKADASIPGLVRKATISIVQAAGAPLNYILEVRESQQAGKPGWEAQIKAASGEVIVKPILGGAAGFAAKLAVDGLVTAGVIATGSGVGIALTVGAGLAASYLYDDSLAEDVVNQAVSSLTDFLGLTDESSVTTLKDKPFVLDLKTEAKVRNLPVRYEDSGLVLKPGTYTVLPASAEKVIKVGAGDKVIFQKSVEGVTVDYAAVTDPLKVDLEKNQTLYRDNAAAGPKDYLGNGVVSVFGSTGDDTITGDARANYLYGNSGRDVLTGMAGDDVLVGASSRNTSGLQVDTLTGGIGADRFVFGGIEGSSLPDITGAGNLYKEGTGEVVVKVKDIGERQTSTVELFPKDYGLVTDYNPAEGDRLSFAKDSTILTSALSKDEVLGIGQPYDAAALYTAYIEDVNKNGLSNDDHIIAIVKQTGGFA